VIGWFGWDVYARRQLHGEVARLQALGQLVTPADFNGRPKLSDSDNAATLYRQAFAIAYSPAQEAVDRDADFNYQLTDAQTATLRTIPASFAANLSLAREARRRSRCDFAEVVTSPMMKRLEPAPERRARAGQISSSTPAVAQHLEGRDGEAVESVRDILHLAAMLDQSDNALVEHLVAIGIAAMGSAEAMELSRELKIGPAPAASREQVLGLIDHLLVDALDSGFGESLKGEQAMTMDSATSFFDSLENTASTGRLMLPAIRLSAVHLSQFLSARIKEIDPESEPATMAHCVPDSTFQHSLHGLVRINDDAVAPEALPVHFRGED